MAEDLELTILMPCLDEAETLERCIVKANAFLKRSGIRGEVLIADNGSTDGSQAIATASGARVADIAERGYGSALKGGIVAARGRYIVMGDSDDSYDFSALEPFVEKLREGYELVMGNRFMGGIKPGAMPKLHKYLGNPVLTFIGRLFFQSKCRDFHCGLRGFQRQSMLDLDLQAPGMEFASEMVVKATVAKIRITEVPTVLWPDGRSRPPHLRSWRDGWRHLRFLLLFSPRWLFLYPGIALFVFGLAATAWLLPAPRKLGSAVLDIHTLYYAALTAIIGFQSVLFWIFAKIHGERERIVPPDPLFASILRVVSLEIGLVAGGLLLAVGMACAAYALGSWGAGHFGALAPSQSMRLVIFSGTAMMLGTQMAYGAFFMSILRIRSRI